MVLGLSSCLAARDYSSASITTIKLQLDQQSAAAFAFHRRASAHGTYHGGRQRHAAAAALIAAQLGQRRHAMLLNGLVFFQMGGLDALGLFRHSGAQFFQLFQIFFVFYCVIVSLFRIYLQISKLCMTQ